MEVMLNQAIKQLRKFCLVGVIVLGLIAIIGSGGGNGNGGDSSTNSSPAATIISPTDGSIYTQGDSVTFTGFGDDAEDGALTGGALVWTSSIDGQIGTGTSCTRDDLSVGAHTITLTVTDNDTATGSDSVSVGVNLPVEMTEEIARQLAEDFVRNSPTFTSEGIEGTLQLVDTQYIDTENAWQFIFQFESLSAGYGDSARQTPLQDILQHEVMIIVEQGIVQSAIMDGLWDMINQRLTECSQNIIDFEDLDAGTRVYNQYGDRGVSFPDTPSIIEPFDLTTFSGTKALSTYYPGEELGGKLVIEFTTGQTCVSMYVGLLEDTYGNKITAKLAAFSAGEVVVIPGYGMVEYPPEQVAVQQRLIGPGPADIGKKMLVQTGDEPQIYRVELSFSGGYFPIIDDLGFATIGDPFPESDSRPQVTIETPKDGECISGFETYPGAFDIMGTIYEEFKLEEVTIKVTQGTQVREGSLSFSGVAPDFTFGGPNVHNLIFPGENQIAVIAKSFSGQSGVDFIHVYYGPLQFGAKAELLILTPDEFYGSLIRLRDLKNSIDISSHIMSLSAIEQEWRFDFEGSRDLPERVKRAIAHAYSYHDTRYVMLVGDGDCFPIRYHKTGREGVSWGFVYPITELYYACLFKPNGEFDNWDGNNNDIIGEWWAPTIDGELAQNFDQINIDNCNLKPDVAVGRIPASSIYEVEAYVSKVIEYEMEEIRDWTTWLDYIILWNSDTDFRNDEAELDYVTDELLTDFEARKHYWSKGYESLENWRNQLIADINRVGAAFAIYFGHGSRQSMGVLDATTIDLQLDNKHMYPIFIASACDTAKFVQEWDIYQDVNGTYPPCWPDCDWEGWVDPRPEPAPLQPPSIDVESMAEVLLLTPEKGGIGFLGSHMGTNHASHPFAKLFIGSWNYEGVGHLGDMWTTAVREFVEQYLEAEYVTECGVDFGRSDLQSHHVHKFVLFGDPSLRLKK